MHVVVAYLEVLFTELDCGMLHRDWELFHSEMKDRRTGLGLGPTQI